MPNKLYDFIDFALEDSDRTTNVLTLLLQNFADERDARNLAKILEVSGSAYDVFKSEKDASEYDKGAYILIERVDDIVNEVSKTALENSSSLRDAWKYCYSRSPDYEKAVTRVCDFLESFLGKTYFPKDPKPQLKKFVHSFEADPAVLAYKGDTIVTPKNLLTNLLKEVSNIRGQHTEGNLQKVRRYLFSIQQYLFGIYISSNLKYEFNFPSVIKIPNLVNVFQKNLVLSQLIGQVSIF